MVTCTLRIGDRIVLSSVGAAPEAEYTLFDPGEIELAANGPGMVQEIGYQTTAADASARLRDLGITWALVLDAGAAMQPTLAMTYARGADVRRIANSLGPAELFDGFRYDAAAKRYDGRWLDLPALGVDLEFPGFTQAAQLLHLLALLEEVTPEAPVRLVTRELMANARPGARSFRRGTVPDVAGLPDALRVFAARLRDTKQAGTDERAVGPSSADLIEMLRDRVGLSPEPESQARLRALEKALVIRQRAERGPLADPELAALDEQLSAGNVDGVGAVLDDLEKSRGKQPATTYLRVRAALVSGRDPPRAVAERISSLALSMPSFVELELLASEAWNCAGDPKRALPFARDLLSNATVNDEFRLRASQRLVAMKPPPAAMELGKATPRQVTRTMHPEAPVSASPTTARYLEPEPLSVPPQFVPPPDAAREGVLRRSSREVPLQSDVKTARPKPRESVVPPVPTIPPPPIPVLSRRETPPMTFGVTDPNEPPRRRRCQPTRNPNLSTNRAISGTWVGPLQARRRARPSGARSRLPGLRRIGAGARRAPPPRVRCRVARPMRRRRRPPTPCSARRAVRPSTRLDSRTTGPPS